jgi:catenin alpha
MNPISFNESKMRVNLETHLESIISSVALMADSESTRPNRRDRIVDECNALRQALQDLLNAYISNVSFFLLFFSFFKRLIDF